MRTHPRMDVITSPSNAAVKAARKLRRRHGRRGTGDFLVEGPQAVSQARGHLRRLFIAADATPPARTLADDVSGRGVAVLPVTPAVLETLATTVTPQGLVGVATLANTPLEVAVSAARLLVVLVGVRDPGNAGTVVRTADAAGADAMVLTAGSVDVRNAKAVRASAGSVFHLPVVEQVTFDAVVACCRGEGIQLVAADARGAVRCTDVDLDRPTALVLGNEAHGLDGRVLEACDVVARVPISARTRPGYAGRAESLNLGAAAAVAVYEAARQQRIGHQDREETRTSG